MKGPLFEEEAYRLKLKSILGPISSSFGDRVISRIAVHIIYIYAYTYTHIQFNKYICIYIC